MGTNLNYCIRCAFAHNHPSGSTEPSANDKDLTRDLVFAAEIMQLKVLDHLIIGDNKYYSFAGSGLIEKYEMEFISLKISAGKTIPSSNQKISSKVLPWQ